MNAGTRHIAKYLDYYKALYPNTPILLLRSSTADFFLNTASRQKVELEPAISTLRAYTSSPDRKLLVHALSNGGCGQLAFLSKVYFELTGSPLPARTVVMDSAPGRSRVQQGVNAFTTGMSKAWYVRLPVMAVFGILITVFFTLPEVFGKKNLANTMRDNLNSIEPEYVSKEARRCYIYSDTDALILDTDIEDHAKQAEERGLKVDTFKFVGTAHVAHMKSDPVKYWAVVEKAWDASS